MKAKTNFEGHKYFFYEEDMELEAVALKLITLLPKHSGSIGKPLKSRLWDCAFNLLETTSSKSVIFRRCQSITNDTEPDRVYGLLGEVINTICKNTNTENEKVVVFDWDLKRTRKTNNMILVRYSTNGKFVGLKTLTDVLIGSIKDIDALLERVNTTIDNITFSNFNRLVSNIKQDQSLIGEDLIRNEFRTIRIAYEDILTENYIDASGVREKRFGDNTKDNWDDDIDI